MFLTRWLKGTRTDRTRRRPRGAAPRFRPSLEAMEDRTVPSTPAASLDYSTYLGGSGSDTASGVAADAASNVYVVGTASAGFPDTGASLPHNAVQNVFVTTLNAAGVVVYSTILGGSSANHGLDIAVDGAGNACVTGWTSSTDFPPVNALQPASGGATDAFLFKLNPSGSALLYSTYLRGSAAEDFLGGADSGIAVDAAGNAYLTGSTTSRNFPTKNALKPVGGGNTDGFVTKIDTTRAVAASLVYSTYLGATAANDWGNGIAVDAAGSAYVTGKSTSATFPTTVGAFQTGSGGGRGTRSWRSSPPTVPRWSTPPTSAAAATRRTPSPWTRRARPSCPGSPAQRARSRRRPERIRPPPPAAYARS